MLDPIWKRVSRGVAGRWLLAGVAGACLAVTGCAPIDWRGDSFPRDDTFDWAGSVRKPDKDLDRFGVSNKSQQVERNLGVGP